MKIPLTIIINMLDIFLVAYLFYRLILLIRGTRATELLKGLFVLFLVAMVTAQLRLNTFNWLLQNTITMFFVALPIVFQPELRRALEQIGRGRFFGRFIFRLDGLALGRIINDLTEAAFYFSENKIGALIVIEREVGLRNYLDMGIQLDAKLNKEILVSIFLPDSHIHDGAVIIRQDRIMAAGCFLPLSNNPYLNSTYGTRHRAAIGISEESDALVIVVSEETGAMSLVLEGEIMYNLEVAEFRKKMVNILANPEDDDSRFKFNWRKK